MSYFCSGEIHTLLSLVYNLLFNSSLDSLIRNISCEKSMHFGSSSVMCFVNTSKTKVERFDLRLNFGAILLLWENCLCLYLVSLRFEYRQL